ncbi:2-C-methyl-D-erythritol 2,4-cyclodiphosphate synthase [Calidithermus terrae]|uniref:2-C-methyl-D-erythritol 2,4-cyclodiphosphate synthase n=1 Tax=Calidithermus terrae TaxID=1408545 RepID=A0A399EAX0_9DEIN|nr:2-C-methyl-D-erythritol 2,4-cyclodiphosphate synthase [Calidithermus terrae]RIH81088.1 2-C-methyl-D-erythritol 2,4-cyclodiphosphate synthase [Calidithermus terrae]
MRIGFGEDAHRLEPGRALWLGGVEIPSERGAVAHSDGDVVLHALCDALLSACALGDIGALFPDTDPRWKGLESRVILEAALARVAGMGYRVSQVSGVVTLDKPKLGPHRAAIQARLAGLLSLPPDRVGLTFKTSEGLAPDHVQARCVALLEAP